jgi:NAD(P)H-hydrate repair Nnr-like enzyme with NAD(P)H-hydrate epimerase domain
MANIMQNFACFRITLSHYRKERQKLEPEQIFIDCLFGTSFATESFCVEQETVIVQDMINSVAAPICSFKVSLRSADLNQSCQ